jgi:hypothetical protein
MGHSTVRDERRLDALISGVKTTCAQSIADTREECAREIRRSRHRWNLQSR